MRSLQIESLTTDGFNESFEFVSVTFSSFGCINYWKYNYDPFRYFRDILGIVAKVRFLNRQKTLGFLMVSVGNRN